MYQPGKQPALHLLSPEDKHRLHQAVRQILEELGMQIQHDGALEVLQRAGCPVEKDNIVRIPGKLLQESMKTAPGNVTIYDRQGVPAMDLGGDRSYFGSGSDLLYAVDPGGKGRHLCVLEDVRRSALVCDALPNIDFIMSFAYPSDVPHQSAFLTGFQAMTEYSTKPIVCTAEGRADLEKMYEIAEIVRGGGDQLKARPYFIHYAEPASPRKHPYDSLDKLLFCADKAVPLVYSPAPMAGATAPVTIAGHVAQGLAECFCGLVIHQLRAEGAPFIMGMGPAILDLATTQCSYNAPEYYLAYLAAIEMSHYYNLPSWGYAGTSDAQIPDGQAVFEAGLITFLSAMSGANLNHDVGYMDFGRTGSLEMVVIMDELIDQIRRFRKGVPVDDETLGLDVIRDVGLNSHFLEHEHTFQHAREVQWRPKLTNRVGYDQWEETGGLSFRDKAAKRLQEILETHRPRPLSEEKALKIQDLVDRFEM